MSGPYDETSFQHNYYNTPRCAQCKCTIGRYWPGTREHPPESDLYDDAVEDSYGNEFCSTECMDEYHAESFPDDVSPEGEE